MHLQVVVEVMTLASACRHGELWQGGQDTQIGTWWVLECAGNLGGEFAIDLRDR